MLFSSGVKVRIIGLGVDLVSGWLVVMVFVLVSIVTVTLSTPSGHNLSDGEQFVQVRSYYFHLFKTLV